MLKKADTKFRQAKTLYSQGRFEDAIVLAGGSDPTRTSTRAIISCCWRSPKRRSRPSAGRRKQHFLKAIELEPWNPEGYVGLGLLYRQEGMTRKATSSSRKRWRSTATTKSPAGTRTLTGGRRRRGSKVCFDELFGSKKK